ncbi:MAG: hypothetical protein Q8P07_05285 [bacterium]|nr:hypothetical protein [bacterium]
MSDKTIVLRNPLFERFEIRTEGVIELTKIRLSGAAKWVFGVNLEKFPTMEFHDNDKGIVIAPGIVIGDNFSNDQVSGVFTSPYDNTSAKIIPEKLNELVSLVFSGEKLFLHDDNFSEPELKSCEAPPDFYLAFARAVMNALAQEAKKIGKAGL